MRILSAFRALVLVTALASLTGCQSAKKLFGDSEPPPLAGERISVLELQKQMKPDDGAALTAQSLPLPAANAEWPQNGGTPMHNPTHPDLGANIKKAWDRSIGAGASQRNPLTIAPIVARNTVYAMDANGFLTATDLINGKSLWRSAIKHDDEDGGGAVGGGVAYDSGRLYVTAGHKYLYAFNAANGALVWKAPLSSVGRAAPTVYNGRIYVVLLDNTLAVFSTADGSRLWSYAGVAEATSLLGAASVAVDDTLVVLPVSSGEIFGLRPENGRVVWQDNLSAVGMSTTPLSISDIGGLPVIDGDMVFAISFGGKIVAIDKASGVRRWQKEIGGIEMPWVAGDTIFVITDQQQLAALTRGTGAIRWVTQLKRYEDEERKEPVVWSGPVLAGGRLWVTGSQGGILEVDATTGQVRQTLDFSGSDLAPLIAANTLLALTRNGNLVAWR
jgi:outer membrane protein assembly factor BamB